MNMFSRKGSAGIPLMVGLVWLLMASYFGANSLGALIFEGMASGGTRFDKVVAGAVGASALAILFDRLIGRAERALRTA